MSNILILNECHSDNIGDQAIAEAMIRSLQRLGHNVYPQDFSCRPHKETSTSPAPSNLRKKAPKIVKKMYFIFKTIRTIMKISKGPYDAAVIGGGQLILGNSNFSFAMYLWVNALKLFQKKVFIICVGAGTEFTWLETFLYKNSLSKADKLFVRDSQSLLTIKNSFNIDASLCPDIAYALYMDLPKLEKRKICIICITDYSVFLRYHKELLLPEQTQVSYLQEWLEITAKYIAQGYEIKLGATTDEDLKQTKKLHQLIGPIESILPAEEVPSVEGFLKLASTADIVVAGRMHALILAQVAGATPVPYIISKKIASFAEEYLVTEPREQKEKLEATLSEILPNTTVCN